MPELAKAHSKAQRRKWGKRGGPQWQHCRDDRQEMLLCEGGALTTERIEIRPAVMMGKPMIRGNTDYGGAHPAQAR